MRMVIWNLEYGICIKVCCFLVLNMAQMYMCHPAVCFFLRAWGKQKKKKKKILYFLKPTRGFQRQYFNKILHSKVNDCIHSSIPNNS